ncbi:MAG: amino acid adenylation domain-containing protein, partial [Rhizomicrobium sp.]
PIPNTRISIRSDTGVIVPPGTVGEVWLGGVGLAQGYLNNPILTAKHFVETSDGHFYRTGDLGRWTADGRLELQGRIDHQVKLHGQRIELGEIEQILQTHPTIAEAVVVMTAAANETKTLHGFIRLNPESVMPDEDVWRAHLAAHLPPHMIPASVTKVASFPLTPSGKLDRKALLQKLKTSENQKEKNKTPPGNALEDRIAAVWQDLLNVTVDREDNFFALGGNSLLAVTLAHRLSQAFEHPISARDLFAAPVLADFAQRVARTTASPHDMTEQVPESDHATEGQKEFWVAEAAGLDTRTFTIPLIQSVLGNTPSIQSWRSAWATLVGRHQSLRTSFAMDTDGILHQKISPPSDNTIAFSCVTHPDTPSALAFIRQCQQAPLSMMSAPLWRAGLVAIESTGEKLFWLALHHSVGDGQSVGILSAELSALLRGDHLPEITGSFAQTAAREDTYLTGHECSEDAQYWNSLLARVPDNAFEEGPLDTARSSTKTPGTHRFEVRLDCKTTENLKALARSHNTSLHAVMLALLAWEARRRTARDDVLVGTTASVRETASDAKIVGYYVNMLPIAVHQQQSASFGDILNEAGGKLAGALSHARYPFARIYQNLRTERALTRHPARYPLFDMAVTENPPPASPSGSVALTRRFSAAYEYWPISPGEDMVLSHEQLPDGQLMLQLHVNAAVYSQETAECWFTALQGWAKWLTVAGQADMPLPGILPDEAAQLKKWEYGARIDRPAKRFHEIFEHRHDTNEKNADTHCAVLTQTDQRTYAEVERDANVLANTLIGRGVKRGDTVAVLTGRSITLASAVLGIWKSAATYLPLSADLPAERLAFMAKDCGISHLIALDGLGVPAELEKTVSTILRPEVLDALSDISAHRPDVSGSPDDIAYIIYTSGSTGRPKGVRISHRSYVNIILGTGEAYGLTADDRSLMFSSPSFDVSLSDIGLPLAFGATLCPVSYDILSAPNKFRAFLNDLKITVADITPSYLRLFDGAALPTLRILVTGGEAPYPSDIITYAANLQYYNAYGPTENTISSTMAVLTAEPQLFLSAGRPLPNTSVHVCDPNGNPVPPGVMGELWLGGSGLAHGYVGRPDLTAAAFVHTAWGRRYRTGDIGRWHTNGALEIMGRTDDQVKLNGIRVELGEIESALATHPDIAQAVAVLDHTQGYEHSLWAFVSPRPGKHAPAEDSWRQYLADRLPGYMIPSVVTSVESIPLSDSGKVDKAALKQLLDGRDRNTNTLPPEDGLERDIARIWQDLLKVQNIHRDDNFFALGGHSLLAIAVTHRLEALLGYPVSARDLFAEPTLRGFSHRVSQTTSPSAGDVATNHATQGQREFWVAEQAGLDTRGFIIPLTMIVQNADDITTAQWHTAWTALVHRHEALRTGFRVDETGTLHRFITPPETAALEISEQPDLNAALHYSQSCQGKAFVMSAPPLWRAGIIRIRQTRQTLFWMALHHSVGDGVSLGILTSDLAKLVQGQTLLPLSSSLDLVAGREETYLSSHDCQSDARYWQQTLAKTPPLDEWPLDFTRPNGRTAQNARGAHTFRIPLDADIAARLRAFASKNGASLHTLFLTLMALEIARRCERSEFLLGTAVSTRETAHDAQLVGYFVNMLPLPCQIDRTVSVEQNLRMMQAALADGLQHTRYPFARIYQDFRRDHTQVPSPARYPLFDFAVAENPVGPPSHSGIAFVAPPVSPVESYSLRPNAPAQDMVLVHEGRPDGGLT